MKNLNCQLTTRERLDFSFSANKKVNLYVVDSKTMLLYNKRRHSQTKCYFYITTSSSGGTGIEATSVVPLTCVVNKTNHR